MFFTMLGKFEDMTFLELMKKIAEAIDDAANTDPNNPKLYKEKMKAIMDPAHQLKSPAGYIGAAHIHYACYFIQENFLYDRYPQMLEYYPTLIEAAVTFRIYSRKLIAQKNCK